MARRSISGTGYYHIVVRSAGQVALFEDDADRRRYLSLLRAASDGASARVIAWVLMTDHVHLVVDFGEDSSIISSFMLQIDSPYSRYFNAKTGREGTLFQGSFWSKPIENDAQLIATVYYIHMNPEVAGIAPMRDYRWSSYREYAGMHWVVDTTTVLNLFGGFKAFDEYRGSQSDVVREPSKVQDSDVVVLAESLSNVSTTQELRTLPIQRRNKAIRSLHEHGISNRKIARAFGIGATTVARVLSG